MQIKEFVNLNNRVGYNQNCLCKLYKKIVTTVVAASVVFSVMTITPYDSFALSGNDEASAIEFQDPDTVTTTNTFEGTIDLINSTYTTGENGISYDSTTKTLTLDNVTISATDKQKTSAIYFTQDIGSITIVIKGTCKINGFHSMYRTDINIGEMDVTIKGEDSSKQNFLYLSGGNFLSAGAKDLKLQDLSFMGTSRMGGWTASGVISIENCIMDIAVINKSGCHSCLYSEGDIQIKNSNIKASMLEYNNNSDLVKYAYPAISALGGYGKDKVSCVIENSELSLSCAHWGIYVGYSDSSSDPIYGDTQIKNSKIAFDCLNGLKAYVNDADSTNPTKITIDSSSELTSSNQNIIMVNNALRNGSVEIESGAKIEGTINSSNDQIEIRSDVTWNNDYTIPENTSLVVNQGVTLTLSDGATIIKGTGSTIKNNGTIKAGCNTTLSVDEGNEAEIAAHVYEGGICTVCKNVHGENEHEYENGVCTICGAYEDKVGARLAGHSISLDGSIGVNFYMELSEETVKDTSAYMEFTLPNGNTKTIYVNTINPTEMNGKTYYVFPCEVAAMEMNDTIKAQIKTTNANGTVYTYTVKEYAEYLIQNKDSSTDYAAAYDLVKSMIDYGSYSQLYANHNTDNLASTNLTDMSNVQIPEYTYKANENEKNVKLAGANLSLLSKTTLRMYFTISNVAADNVSFTYNGSTLEKTKLGQYYYVELTDIPAHQLGSSCTVTVNDGTNEFNVEYTPMAYCYNVVSRATNQTRTDALKNLIKALYQYNQEASKYINRTTEA